jgi:hypothetical protein
MRDEIGHLLHWMPIVLRGAGVSEAQRRFCAGIVARSRRGGWRPSGREIAAMRRIVGDFRARALRDPAAPDPVSASETGLFWEDREDGGRWRGRIGASEGRGVFVSCQGLAGDLGG